MVLKDAAEVLGSLEKGNLAKDWLAAIQDVLAACQEQGEAKGSVTLKLSFGVKDEMVAIKAKLDTVVPKADRRTSSFFVTGDGRLSLQHPAQISMFAGSRFERGERQQHGEREDVDD